MLKYDLEQELLFNQGLELEWDSSSVFLFPSWQVLQCQTQQVAKLTKLRCSQDLHHQMKRAS
jgi:hypothetical protein